MKNFKLHREICIITLVSVFLVNLYSQSDEQGDIYQQKQDVPDYLNQPDIFEK